MGLIKKGKWKNQSKHREERHRQTHRREATEGWKSPNTQREQNQRLGAHGVYGHTVHMNFKKLFAKHGNGKAVAIFRSPGERLGINLNYLSRFQKWHLLGHLWLCIELGKPVSHEPQLFQNGVSLGWFSSGPQSWWLDKRLPGWCKADYQGSVTPNASPVCHRASPAQIPQWALQRAPWWKPPNWGELEWFSALPRKMSPHSAKDQQWRLSWENCRKIKGKMASVLF